MTSTKAATCERTSIIGPSRTFGWLGVVVVGTLTAVTPIAEWSVLRLPPMVATPVAALGLMLALWYFDLAPRLAWNAHGVASRSACRVSTARWPDVDSAWMIRSTTAGDRIIVQAGGHRFDIGLDRSWWLARLSSRYATRNSRLLEEIRLGRDQADCACIDGQPPSLHRFAPLVFALACWSGGLAVALILA